MNSIYCLIQICGLQHILGNTPVDNCMKRFVPNRGAQQEGVMAQGSKTPLCPTNALRLNLKVDKDDDW